MKIKYLLLPSVALLLFHITVEASNLTTDSKKPHSIDEGGRVTLSQEAIEENSIVVETAQSESIPIWLEVTGQIIPDQEVTLPISARFPGVVKEVYKRLGDRVEKGEPLALVESNDSLQSYTIKSDLEGVVIKKEVTVGMNTSPQQTLFVVSDLKRVVAHFSIYHPQVGLVSIGDPVVVKSLDGKITQASTISYISPVGDEKTQSVGARAFLDNSDNYWKLGLFVSGKITVDTPLAKVAVKESALQTLKNHEVVFREIGHQFEAVAVKIGHRNNQWVEITDGFREGDRYVSQNSYILKAELEKSGVEH